MVLVDVYLFVWAQRGGGRGVVVARFQRLLLFFGGGGFLKHTFLNAKVELQRSPRFIARRKRYVLELALFVGNVLTSLDCAIKAADGDGLAKGVLCQGEQWCLLGA